MSSAGTKRVSPLKAQSTVMSIATPAALKSPTVTPEARRYAIHELARRAGVRPALRESWQIEFADRATIIHFEADGKKKIVFPVHASPESTLHSLVSSATSRGSWAYPPSPNLQALVPDFFVPFAGRGATAGTPPIFSASDSETICFNFDLPLAALLTMARVEEIVEAERDIHGRFPASASIAVKQNFLHRPIVDEYGFALEQALKCLLPQWSPLRKPLRAKLSHDVDELGIPFSLRSTLAHTLQRRTPQATLHDLLAQVSDRKPVYLSLLFQIAQLSMEYGLDSAFYWKASAAGDYDSGYNPRHPKITSTLRWLQEQGFENGVHPGYKTFRSPEELIAEVDRLRGWIGTAELGGRQHYLRWLPQTWRHWEVCGLGYDSSVGFADQIGFRAGTCLPYRPWLWEENREANLVEIPLLVMDRTLVYYMKLSPGESLSRVLDCVKRCRAVGGVFTMLWHNEALIDPLYGDLYRHILLQLSGAAGFDWRLVD